MICNSNINQSNMAQEFARILAEFDNAVFTDAQSGGQNLVAFSPPALASFRKMCQIGSRAYARDEDCKLAILREMSAEEYALANLVLKRRDENVQ